MLTKKDTLLSLHPQLLSISHPNSQLIIYRSPSGDIKIDVRFESETVWLTQKHMAELFQTSVPNINMHLKGIFEEGDLDEE